MLLLAGALALAVVIAYYFWPVDEAPAPVDLTPLAPPPVAEVQLPEPAPPPPPPESVVEPAPQEALANAEAGPAEPLPALHASDGFVRERAKDLNLPSAWIASDDDLVRRFAVLLENAARGEVPTNRLSSFSPRKKFAVRREGRRFLVDPAGYARYDPYLDRLEAIPPEALAGFIRTLRPLLNQALGELGHGGAAQDAALAAIEQALATPAIQGEIELVRPKVLFQYADPALEELGGLQKQVLRMGPRNAQRLRTYLTRLRPLLK